MTVRTPAFMVGLGLVLVAATPSEAAPGNPEQDPKTALPALRGVHFVPNQGQAPEVQVVSSATNDTPDDTRALSDSDRFFAAAIQVAQYMLAGETLWVGYQSDCMVRFPDSASWFHDDNWVNFAVPGPTEGVRLGYGPEWTNPGWPTYIHFGDFCVNVSECPDPVYLPAGDAEVEFITVYDDSQGSWVFDMGPGQVIPGGPCENTPTESGTLTIGGNLIVGAMKAGRKPGAASLTIRNGPVFVRPRNRQSALVQIGKFNATSGTLTVEGERSLLDLEGQMMIGSGSSGTLNIVSGGRVLVSGDQPRSGGSCIVGMAGAHGSVFVDGDGSLWSSTGQIQVGRNGSGEVTVSNSAAVTSGSESLTSPGVHIGTMIRSAGVATVTGAGSRWEHYSSLVVGNRGTGELKIEDGGRISSAGAHIGRFDGGRGSVLVDGLGSRWEISGPLRMGGNEERPTRAVGELVIRAGGGVTAGDVIVGHNGGKGSVALARRGFMAGRREPGPRRRKRDRPA